MTIVPPVITLRSKNPLVRLALILAAGLVWFFLVAGVALLLAFFVQYLPDSVWSYIYTVPMFIILIQFMVFANAWFNLIIAIGRNILASIKVRQRRRRRRLSGP